MTQPRYTRKPCKTSIGSMVREGNAAITDISIIWYHGVPSCCYHRDRPVGHLSPVDHRRCPEKALHRVAFQSPLGIRRGGRIPRACMPGIYKWQNSIVRSIPIAVVHARFPEERATLRSLPRFPPAASAPLRAAPGKNPRHNAGASRKVANARKHRIRKIGGHCCDRSFRF